MHLHIQNCQKHLDYTHYIVGRSTAGLYRNSVASLPTDCYKIPSTKKLKFNYPYSNEKERDKNCQTFQFLESRFWPFHWIELEANKKTRSKMETLFRNDYSGWEQLHLLNNLGQVSNGLQRLDYPTKIQQLCSISIEHSPMTIHSRYWVYQDFVINLPDLEPAVDWA